MQSERLKQNLREVEARIGEAAARAGRAANVDIIAVTKSHPVDAVRAALATGLRKCGENRVPELEEKVGEVGRDAVEWHLIGHLQRNKVKRALPLFDLVHSVDSLRLAQELSDEAARKGGRVNGLVQINVSGEETKGGIETADAAAARDEIAAICALPGLHVQGLMTMAPYTEEEAVLRRVFGTARQLFDDCGTQVDGFEATHLSMGMSNDYVVAVEEGSTMVRLGTILFGERAP